MARFEGEPLLLQSSRNDSFDVRRDPLSPGAGCARQERGHRSVGSISGQEIVYLSGRQPQFRSSAVNGRFARTVSFQDAIQLVREPARSRPIGFQ